jgi:thiol-disulfide isomerase/thioredoxin
MKKVTYDEALTFLKNDSNKIKVVVFYIENCPTCDDFLPDLFNVEIEKRSDHFEVVYVDSESQDIPFPPSATPTAYFYIPNTEEPMPFFRVGGTIPSVLEKDLDGMIKIKDEGILATEAFSFVPEEITSWGHRQLRFG